MCFWFPPFYQFVLLRKPNKLRYIFDFDFPLFRKHCYLCSFQVFLTLSLHNIRSGCLYKSPQFHFCVCSFMVLLSLLVWLCSLFSVELLIISTSWTLLTLIHVFVPFSANELWYSILQQDLYLLVAFPAQLITLPIHSVSFESLNFIIWFGFTTTVGCGWFFYCLLEYQTFAVHFCYHLLHYWMTQFF